MLIKSYGSLSFNTFRQRDNDEIYTELLKRHKVSVSKRIIIVDWMYETFIAYKRSNETYFLAVYILDKYLNNAKKVVYDEDIHLLGVTSAFLASKFEDVFPLCVNKMVKICSNKFST